jgi:hypothetical protein
MCFLGGIAGIAGNSHNILRLILDDRQPCEPRRVLDYRIPVRAIADVEPSGFGLIQSAERRDN